MLIHELRSEYGVNLVKLRKNMKIYHQLWMQL